MNDQKKGNMFTLVLLNPDIKSSLENSVARPHAQWVTYLTADPGVMSLILAQSHTFVKIDLEIISTAILLPFTDSRKVVVSYN